MSDSDKRVHPRLPVNLPATYCSSNLIIDAYVSNLSQAGLFLRCSAVDSEGTGAEITISLPNEPNALVVAGTVIWSCALPGRASGMGVRFGSLDKTVSLALANYLLHSNYVRGPD